MIDLKTMIDVKIFKPTAIPFPSLGMVYTNGVFDIIHAGHIRFLQRAKQFGQKLVVALNSDQSVRHLKGETRPINKLEDRLDTIAALSCVDGVTWFEKVDCSDLIRVLRPHCWVKAGYSMKTLNPLEVAAAKEGGTAIVILEKFGDYSTTGITERMKG